jgi:F-type H+-transporting ATPase subunit delta
MKEYRLAERYAGALGEAMPDTDRLEAALDHLCQLSELIGSHHDLRSCLCNHAIDTKMRAKVLEHVLKGLGAETVVTRLTTLLLERGRITLIPDITCVLTGILDARRNRLSGVVTSAHPLTPEQKASIEKSLANYSGKSVRMNCQVDPDLLGGVVAQIGGQVIDGSLRTQLNQLRNALIAEEI